jgi:SAM-dependent methyltransferase
MRSALCQDHPRKDIFEKIAPHYDLLLGILTFGNYAKFLRKAVKVLGPKRDEKILDLCSGTGRVASWILQAVGEEGEVTGMDITQRGFIRYLQLLHGLKLRKPLEEDDRKALPTGRQAYSGAKLDRRETN